MKSHSQNIKIDCYITRLDVKIMFQVGFQESIVCIMILILLLGGYKQGRNVSGLLMALVLLPNQRSFVENGAILEALMEQFTRGRDGKCCGIFF